MDVSKSAMHHSYPYRRRALQEVQALHMAIQTWMEELKQTPESRLEEEAREPKRDMEHLLLEVTHRCGCLLVARVPFKNNTVSINCKFLCLD